MAATTVAAQPLCLHTHFAPLTPARTTLLHTLPLTYTHSLLLAAFIQFISCAPLICRKLTQSGDNNELPQGQALQVCVCVCICLCVCVLATPFCIHKAGGVAAALEMVLLKALPFLFEFQHHFYFAFLFIFFVGFFGNTLNNFEHEKP